MTVSSCRVADSSGYVGSYQQEEAKPRPTKNSQRYSHVRLLQDVQNIRKTPNLRIDLPFATEIVELWMKYCDSASQSGCTQSGSLFSTDQLSCILQVASFLQDERSLSDAAESMARLICEHLAHDESAGHEKPCGPDTGNARALITALVALPPEPLHLVLKQLPLHAALALPQPLLAVALSAQVSHGTLNLSSAPLRTPAAVTAVSATLPTVSGLLRLDLRATRLASGPPSAAAESTTALADALCALPSLTGLLLSNTALGSPGTSTLAPALASLTQLSLLDMSDNRIGQSGAAALARHLTTLSALTCLDLALNGVRDPGMRALAHLLPHLSTLHTLHLSFNAATAKGLSYLTASISKGIARAEDPGPRSAPPDLLPYPSSLPEPSSASPTPSPEPRAPSTPSMPSPEHPTPCAMSAELSPLRHQQSAALSRSMLRTAGTGSPPAATVKLRVSYAGSPHRKRSHSARSSRSVGSPPAIPATIPESEAIEAMSQTGTPQLPKQGSFPLAARDRRPTSGSPFRPARSTAFDSEKGSTSRAPSRLRVLTLRGNNLSGGEEGGSELARTRTGRAFARLEDLVLSNCGLGDQGAEAVASALQRNSRLRTLRLAGNAIGPAGGKALAGALVTLDMLRRVDLGSNDLGDAGVAAVAESIRMVETLAEVDLSANGCGEAGCAALAAAIPDTMACLRLCSNDVGDAGAAALAGKLKGCTALEELWVADAAVRPAGVVALAQSLAGLPRLLRLRLNHNYIGRGGAPATAAAVAALPALRVLELKGCGLKSGVLAVAKSIRRHPALEAADLSLNQLPEEDVPAVQACLQECPTLRVLDLTQAREERGNPAA